MKKGLNIIIGAALVCCVILPGAGCAKKETAAATTANNEAAIEKAGSIADNQKKYDFLMNEAEGFMSAGKYEDAAKVGEYIVDKVNDTDATRRLLKKAYEKTMGNMVGSK